MKVIEITEEQAYKLGLLMEGQDITSSSIFDDTNSVPELGGGETVTTSATIHDPDGTEEANGDGYYATPDTADNISKRRTTNYLANGGRNL